MDSSILYRSVHNIEESSMSTFEKPCCGMIHYMPSIESLDPRIKEIYKGMHPPNSPKYGLGYVEQFDTVIPSCRLTNPLPKL